MSHIRLCRLKIFDLINQAHHKQKTIWPHNKIIWSNFYLLEIYCVNKFLHEQKCPSYSFYFYSSHACEHTNFHQLKVVKGRFSISDWILMLTSKPKMINNEWFTITLFGILATKRSNHKLTSLASSRDKKIVIILYRYCLYSS